MKYNKSYLIDIQFLGFRFHGWQKQQDVKTLHQMVDKTLGFVFEHLEFKTLGVGRTDSKVSASTYVLQLFINDVIDSYSFLEKMNSNLPQDIRALHIKEVPIDFNILQQPKLKEYMYIFSFGEKNHPFAAPFIVNIEQNLNVELMQEGAKLFEGEHFFHKFCTKPTAHTVFKRTLVSCVIERNDVYRANFFPENSYMLLVRGSGFLRYQVRLMMGILFELGKGATDLNFIRASLKEDNDRKPLKTIAPSSGLQLYNIEFLS